MSFRNHFKKKELNQIIHILKKTSKTSKIEVNVSHVAQALKKKRTQQEKKGKNNNNEKSQKNLRDTATISHLIRLRPLTYSHSHHYFWVLVKYLLIVTLPAHTLTRGLTHT